MATTYFPVFLFFPISNKFSLRAHPFFFNRTIARVRDKIAKAITG